MVEDGLVIVRFKRFKSDLLALGDLITPNSKLNVKGVVGCHNL